MAISWVGSTQLTPAGYPNIVNTATATYTVGLPTGLTDGALVFLACNNGFTAVDGLTLPSGWTQVKSAQRSLIYVSTWHTGNPTSITITASGSNTNSGAAYWFFICFAYNGATFDSIAVVENSPNSPSISPSTPYDWLVSVYCPWNLATVTSPTCGGSITNRQSRNVAFNGTTWGIATADTAAYIPLGISSSSAYSWTPANETTTGWATYSIAISGAFPPSLPTNYSPANNGYVDFTSSQQFSATYNNTDGSVCGAYQFRIKPAGSSYSYWNATTGALQSTAVWNTGNSLFTLPAGILSNSNTYNWSFNTQSSIQTTLSSGFAPDFTVIGQPPPRVTVTAPTGTQATAAVTVLWSASAGGTTAITSYRVVTYLAATVTTSGFTPGQASGILDDSGVVVGTATSYTTGYLPNGSACESFVQVTQSGNQNSAWASTSYTVGYPTPATPTLSATTGTDSNGAPCVTLTVVAPASPTTSGSLTADIFYTDALNPTATMLRTAPMVPATGATVYIADYEAVFGVPRTYYVQIVSGIDGPSPASNTVTATLTSSSWVLSDPLDPTRFLTLRRLASSSSGSTSLQAQVSVEIDRNRDQTIFYPFGKSTATVQYGTVYQPTFTLNFILQGYAQKNMYDLMWSSTRTLLVRSDVGDAWYVDAGALRPLPVLSGGDRVANPWYPVSLSCTVTDRP